MSVIQTNARGVDVVELEFYTKGTNQAQVTTRDNVVDSTKDYVFGVSELIIPNSSLPLFKPGTTQELFSIRYRAVGNGAVTYADIQGPQGTVANVDTTFSISDTKKFFSIPQMISELSAWAGTFSAQIDAVGVTAANQGAGANNPGVVDIAANSGTRWLYVDITASGHLILKCASDFLNHFIIKASPLAVKLFGLEKFLDPTPNGDYIGITFDPQAAAADAYSHRVFNNAGNVIIGQNISDFNLVGSKSMFATCDARLCTTVESHLNYPSSMKVVDSKEQTDRSIGRYYYNTDTQVQLNSDNGILTNSSKITTKSRLGQVALKKRQDPIQKWTQLTDAYEQRLFRFQVYTEYRVFNPVTRKYTLDRVKVPFADDDYWTLTITFVSRS
jgi:hypothetical protein